MGSGPSTASAQAARTDSGYATIGDFPRFESDPYIHRPTASAEPTFTSKETEQQWGVAFKYGMPIGGQRWSSQLSVPVEQVTATSGKQAAGLGDVAFTVNHELSQGDPKQAVSLQLTANTATNQLLGNDQWEITGTYTLRHWFAPRISTAFLPSWTYGFWVDSGKTREDVIEPRLIFNVHGNGDRTASLDLRPRIDLSRGEFYSTLMPFISSPLGKQFSGQLGFEFPLSQLAAKRVENSRVYMDISHGW